MKSEDLTNKSQTQAPYASPDVMAVEINVHKVLCVSDPNSPEQYGNDTW